MSKLRELAETMYCPRYEDSAICDNDNQCTFNKCPRAALLAEVERRDQLEIESRQLFSEMEKREREARELLERA